MIDLYGVWFVSEIERVLKFRRESWVEMQKLMESLYNNKNKSSKMVNVNSQKTAVSPLMIKYLSSNSASNSSSSSRSRSSRDPFSPLSCSSNCNSPLSGVFDEDDVLVMDGISVNSPPSGSNIADFYKTELCRSWEDLGKCRFSVKCQVTYKLFEKVLNEIIFIFFGKLWMA